MTDPAGVQDNLDLVQDLLARAKRAGAEAADALVYQAASLEASYRMGKPEDLERAEARDLGLRVFIGKRQAIVSCNDFSISALDEACARAVAMAKAAPEDPYCGLADPALISGTNADLDLYDDYEPDAATLYETARRAEEAAMAVPGVANSEGGGAGWSRAAIALATSDGFCAGYASSSHSLHASVIAGEGTAMERDYDFASAHHVADLEDAALVGTRAGELAVKRLNPRKVETQQVPVIFDPRVSRGLIGHLAGAISGPAVARGTSFMKDKLGETIFPSNISIIDDPHRPRGLASKPFDGEGVANGKRSLIKNGVLTSWLMNSSAARQLNLQTTGHASRSTGGPPGVSTTNLYMAPGPMTPAALMADIDQGLYVTELIGFGVNAVTGDYSRGAAGFWIDKGEITFPVSELTIAGNLIDIFANLTAANDLEFRYGSNAPTIRVDGMTVAGA